MLITSLNLHADRQSWVQPPLLRVSEKQSRLSPLRWCRAGVWCPATDFIFLLYPLHVLILPGKHIPGDSLLQPLGADCEKLEYTVFAPCCSVLAFLLAWEDTLSAAMLDKASPMLYSQLTLFSLLHTPFSPFSHSSLPLQPDCERAPWWLLMGLTSLQPQRLGQT